MRILIFIVSLNFIIVTSIWALPYKGSNIVMTAASPQAVVISQKIAESGGNVVDVAVSLALAMSVTSPQFAALGGGGFVMVKMGKTIDFLDFRERAPQSTSPNFFTNKPNNSSITGATAIAVPGLPAGLWELHKRFGKLHWSKLLDGPILLAQKGFRVSGDYVEALKKNSLRLDITARPFLLKNSTDIYSPGEIFVQKKLGSALSEMRNRNITSFYTGRIAKDIVETVQKRGGVLSLKDLADYKPIWRKPLIYEYRGHKLYLAPPPSSGGIVIQTALDLSEKIQITKFANKSIEEFHLLGQVLNRAFISRAFIADPDHQPVNVAKLTDKNYFEKLAKTISVDEAKLAPTEELNLLSEPAQTTHLSVIDKFGNAVSMTITLNGNFGSGVASEQFGILLNNEMDDFTTDPKNPNLYELTQGQLNMIAPGKRPLSSMSPTLVEKDGKVVLALGAPGGPRIISSVFQVLYRVLARGESLETAIEAPRVHQQVSPNKLFVDENRFTPETIVGLENKKNAVEQSWQGTVYGVRATDGVLEAVFDTRNEGAAGGF